MMEDIFLETLNFKNKMLLNKILEWRNDLQTRNNSINTSIITENIFHNIIKKYKTAKYKPLIIYYNTDKTTETYIPVGILTFVDGDVNNVNNVNNDNNDNNDCYIGINIDPNYRNRQIASKALSKFINQFTIQFTIQDRVKDRFKDKIYAKIKKQNMSSIKLFSKLFIYSHMDEDFVYYYYDFSNKNHVISSNGNSGSL